MKVFGRGGLFNVTNRTQPMGNSTVHIIEGNIEVKRNGEQGVDIYKFQIESFSQKQIDYRSGKFIQGAGIMFCGDLHGGVIKIKGDADLISNNHFFNDNTKAMTNAPVNNQPAPGQNTYGGYGQQSAPPANNGYAAQQAPPTNNYGGYGATPTTPTYAAPPAASTYAAPATAPTYYNQAPPVAPVQSTDNYNQAPPAYVPPTAQPYAPQNNTPAFASPAVNAMPQANGEPQQTQQVNYADLFANNQNK